MVLLVCLGAFCASFMDAIGGGGGIIDFPTYLLAGLPMHFALGTNKLFSCTGTVASTVRYIKNGEVVFMIAAMVFYLLSLVEMNRLVKALYNMDEKIGKSKIKEIKKIIMSSGQEERKG